MRHVTSRHRDATSPTVEHCNTVPNPYACHAAEQLGINMAGDGLFFGVAFTILLSDKLDVELAKQVV